MTAREWFEYGLGLLEEHREASPFRNAKGHPTTVGFHAALIAAAEELRGLAKSKRRKPLTIERAIKLIHREKYPNASEFIAEIRAPFQTEADRVMNEHSARTKQIEAGLSELAPYAEVRPGELRKFAWIYGNSYSTQGFGAQRYAQNAAELQADRCRHYGIEVEVRAVGERPKCSGGPYWSGACWSPDYEVHAAVESDVDVEILRRRPGPTLRESVRLCWKRGVNPRVFNPFLPHGYEERVGLDFFGNEVQR
jgi:hypothetical protein